MWVDVEELSEDPNGDLEAGSARRDRVGSIETDRGTIHVSLEKTESRDGFVMWRISSATVARIPYLYAQVGYGPLGEHLPEFFFTTSFLKVQLWQWIGILILAIIAYLLSCIIVWALKLVICPAVRRTRTEMDDQLVEAFAPPVKVLVTFMLFSGLSLVLELAPPAEWVIDQLVGLGEIAAVTWLIMRLLDIFSKVMEKKFESQDRRAAIAVLPMGRRTAKIVFVMLACIVSLQMLGFNITGLLASLGIGGLAVALAAQRSLENMFAGVSLISDQPVRVGDFCKFGDEVGWVEDIGLRSTKIRTLDRSIVAVPNSQFAELHLDNLAKRDSIRFYTVLGLRYETSADQLRHVIIELRRLLIAHPKVSLEPFWRVRFIGFGDYSLNVEIFAYTRTTDYGEYRAIQEDLLLRIFDIVEASGTAIAFPSQTAYLGRDSGIDDESGDKAVETVRAMKEDNELPFPEFRPEVVEEMSDSLPYPPDGAAARDS